MNRNSSDDLMYHPSNIVLDTGSMIHEANKEAIMDNGSMVHESNKCK